MSIRLDKIITGLRGDLVKAEPLSKLTWLRVGGPADWLFTPANAKDLQHFLRQCPAEVPIMPLGAGSNTLVRDGGVDGVVLHLSKHVNAISHTDGSLRAEAGCSDAEVARYAAKAGLAGLEFMVTIPGTIGGGLVMNAGCYGKEFKDVLQTAEGFKRDGTPFNLTAESLQMRYRATSLPEGWIFTAASFDVQTDSPEAIRARMKEMIAARAQSQPVGVRTGGSTFANPDGTKAWQEIDAAGCRGWQRGDATISEKHCNFLINKGSACAEDLEQLGEDVRDAVEAKSGIRLRWEIRRIGRKGGIDASI
jgi:UDP-N-acetylmuramate dehydrogenase